MTKEADNYRQIQESLVYLSEELKKANRQIDFQEAILNSELEEDRKAFRHIAVNLTRTMAAREG